MHKFSNSNMLQDCNHEGDCLTVTFKNGKQYRYFGVPTEVFNNFKSAESAGSYFGNEIRGKYRHEKVEEE